LCHAANVDRFFEKERPEIVILAAAKVGGILANREYPVEFLGENLRIACNVIQSAFRHRTRRLLFLGSSCIYPRDAPQPMHEDCLLTSALESTNEAYALAKICGLKLCQYYRREYGVLFHSLMPTNLYGPGDNYHPEHSHVLPALIRRFHEAKEQARSEVVVWGSGKPLREFLHVDDLASAVIHMLGLDDPPDWVNVGTGTDVSIRELAELVRETVGFSGRIVWDAERPDGTPRKLLDITRITQLGWRSQISLKEGLSSTYRAFLQELRNGEARL
jgi:GDP-L-fucose synthase